MDFQEEYRKLKEEVTALSTKKNTLERQLRDVKSLKKQKVELLKTIRDLEKELDSQS